MIFDAVPFSQTLTGSDLKNKALAAFANYVENRLGARVMFDVQKIPFGRPDLREPLQLAALLRESGVIKSFGQTSLFFPDEPPMRNWTAVCNNESNHQVGGTTWESDADALYATLSEALERYIWMTQDDYFMNPTRATKDEIGKLGLFVPPEDIVGFSEEQRAEYPERQLRPDAEYLWIQGTSLVHGGSVYIPAQVVAGIRRRNLPGGAQEPVIRQQNTNGLATWRTQSGARLAGALEVIEREAYMIMWLNQMTLPRIALAPLCAQSPSLARSVAKCERYRLKTHVIQLPTDAPTHAVAVVTEDLSGGAPRFSIGLKAHRSLPYAIEKATTEAIRARRFCRSWFEEGNTWDNSTPVEKIGHRERVYYWSVPENAKKLEFLIQGKEIEIGHSEWDNDDEEQQLQRITQWCRKNEFECISVSLGTSAKNPTSLHIEMVVIPQLQPTYLMDWIQQFGGARWHEVPKALGYTPLKKPFAERPHPFS